MARDFQIAGEVLVRVKFGAHITKYIGGNVFLGDGVDKNSPPSALLGPSAAVAGGSVFELGLTSEGVTLSPKIYHQDVYVDDLGIKVPAEILTQSTEYEVSMRLIHYDQFVLDACLFESAGGGQIKITDTVLAVGKPKVPATFFSPGIPARVSTIMGPPYGQPLGSSGCHFISLNILTPQQQYPWRFPASYIVDNSTKIPLGTNTSMVDLTWRCIPYPTTSGIVNTVTGKVEIPFGELSSSGVTLFDHTIDPF